MDKWENEMIREKIDFYEKIAKNVRSDIIKEIGRAHV